MSNMSAALKKTVGIFCLLVVVFIFTAIKSPNFLTAYNIQNTIRWTSLFGIIAIGVAFVIITGGIDLSIGSVVGLIGCLLPWLLWERGWPLALALPAGFWLCAPRPVCRRARCSPPPLRPDFIASHPAALD